MISRKNRFHGHGSLRYVYQHGKTVRGPLMSIKYALNTRRQDYRLAIVVSKKVHKSAVKRNRIRRRLYEAGRLLLVDIPEAYDLVFTVFHEQLVDLPAGELEHMVRAQLRQASILPAKNTSKPADHVKIAADTFRKSEQA